MKHNETSHSTELLEPVDLAGAVVTFDALHTVRANLAWLVSDKEAHYIGIMKRNQPLLHAQVRALPWWQVPAGVPARERGHGRAETRTVKTGHVSHLEFPWARQAIKITRWRQDAATGKTSRQTVYAVTSLTSADATVQDLARLVREHWSVERAGALPLPKAPGDVRICRCEGAGVDLDQRSRRNSLGKYWHDQRKRAVTNGQFLETPMSICLFNK